MEVNSSNESEVTLDTVRNGCFWGNISSVFEGYILKFVNDRHYAWIKSKGGNFGSAKSGNRQNREIGKIGNSAKSGNWQNREIGKIGNSAKSGNWQNREIGKIGKSAKSGNLHNRGCRKNWQSGKIGVGSAKLIFMPKLPPRSRVSRTLAESTSARNRMATRLCFAWENLRNKK